MLRLILIFMLACCGVASHAEGKLSVYARKLLAGRGQAVPAVMRSAAEGRGLVPAYVHLSPGADPSVLGRLGVEVNIRAGSVVTARIPVDSLAAVSALDCVEYVQTAVPVSPMMDLVRPAVGADRVLAGTGLSRPYTGRGVVVGIIDSGFDYTHPDFYDGVSGELRIRRVWEQGYDGGTPPEGFTYGCEFDTADEILTAAGDVTTNSHGTHVAGIAAGADNSLGYAGIAPDADIVLVSMAGAETENNVNLSDAIAYIYGYAESVGKPCVINMSLGNQSGPHDGTSTFDVIADGLQGPGRLIVGSVGNFGAGKLHASKDFAGGRPDTLRTFIDYKNSLSPQTAGGDIEIWGEPGMELTVNVMTYNTSRLTVGGTMTVGTAAGDASEAEASLRNAVGDMMAFAEVSPLNGKPHVLVSSAVTGLRSGYEIGIEIVSSSAGTVNVWADGSSVALTGNGLDGWADGDDSMSLAEIGGTGNKIISVGAYTTRESLDTENMGVVETGETVGAIASFSSQGPTVDGRVKPDVTAPGCYVVSSVSSNDGSLASYPIAAYYEWNGANRYYAYMQGTSMASPVVAGVVATWLEANPNLSPDDVRGILRSTSVADGFTGDIPASGDNVWGYGKIDAWAGITEAISLASGIGCIEVAECGGLSVRLASGSLSVSGDTGGSPAEVSVVRADGVCVSRCTLDAAEVASGAFVAMPQLPSGVYLVRIGSADGCQTTKIVMP